MFAPTYHFMIRGFGLNTLLPKKRPVSPLATIAIGTVVGLIGLTNIATVQAQDWASWRGPENNGISRETNLIDDISADAKDNLIWEADTGGRSTPIVMDNRVYLNCRTADNPAKKDEKIHIQEQVVCWDAENGTELWRHKFNVFQTDIPAPRVGWAAMCGDPETGNVFVHSVSGIFRCYAPDGTTVWEKSLGEEFGKISGYGGRTQTPIVDEDRVIVSFLATNWGDMKGPAPKHYYYAFDKKTGELDWVSGPGEGPKDTNYSAPAIGVIDGQRLLIAGNGDGHLYAMNARTGKPVWQFRMSRRGLNTTPVIDGNFVYMSHGEDNIDNVEFGRVQCIDARGSGDITASNGVWRVDGIKAGYTALLVKDDILYVVADIGDMIAFDTKTGEQLWTQDLGTVGKGSPIWADGKIYATEVNGNVWVLKPSREKCEVVSHLVLTAASGVGLDEVYSSPAIANGRLYIVSRDRTICLGDKSKQVNLGTPQPLPEEAAATDTPDLLQLRPYEVVLDPGASQKYRAIVFDANGHEIESMDAADLTLSPELDGFTISGNEVTAASGQDKEYAGVVTMNKGDLSANARIRTFRDSETWTWDFDDFKGVQVPPTWIRAFVKIKPFQVEGNGVMIVSGGPESKGRPSHQMSIGPAGMNAYIMQMDVRFEEQRRQMGSLGVSVNRYNLILEGNSDELTVQSWPPHLRMAKSVKYDVQPDVWYTIKLRVDTTDSEAKILGKAWIRGEDEPTDWMLTQTDPHPNANGAPGVYFYAQSDCYLDNVVVSTDLDLKTARGEAQTLAKSDVQSDSQTVDGTANVDDDMKPAGSYGSSVEMATVAEPASWPMWGGTPGRNMVAAVKGVSSDFKLEDEDNDRMVWSKALGSQTYGNPVIASGKVFVGTNNGSGYRDKYPSDVDLGVMLCFDEATGDFIWQLSREKLPAGRVNDWPLQGICSAPHVVGDRMFVVTNRCELMCLDVEGFTDGENDGAVTDEVDAEPQDADIIWNLDMIEDETLGVFPHNLATSSPVVHDGIVYLVTSNGVDEAHLKVPVPGAPCFLAVDAETGEVVWSHNQPKDQILHGQWGSPSMGVVDGRAQVYFPGGDGWIYAHDAKTGEEIWKFDLNPKDSIWELGGAGTRNAILATPVFYENSVIVAVGQDPEHGEGVGHLWRIDATKTGDVSDELGERESAGTPNPNSAKIWHFGGVEEGSDEPIFRRTMSTVAVSDATVYAADLSGFLYCLDLETGKQHWRHDLKSGIWGSPMVADGKVFLGDENGTLNIFKASTESAEVIGEITTVNYSSIYSTPTFANGNMYLSDRTRLYCVKVSE